MIDSQSSLGRDHIVKKLEIQNAARVLLSSDKPLYQPGQTIHLRTLILNERTQKPFAGEPVTFEVSDPKGNKVFKETRKASAFGIASADFALADELNLGRYEIRALAGSTTGERTVEIKRYVLPKFRIQISTDKPYYLPGQEVSGTAQAAYFFGQPVANGDVKLSVATLEEQPVAITNLNGRTDASGRFAFRFALPGYFTGMPQKSEQAFLDLTAEVSDTSQHRETKTLPLSVAQNDLDITVLPEAGALVPGVENILYVLTCYPDGRSAECKVTAAGVVFHSDEQGVCAVHAIPSTADQTCDLEAADAAGHSRKMTFTPDKEAPHASLLLRTDRAVYQTAETMQISVLSPDKDNTVFIDLIKDGQTVLTKSVPLKNHRAQYSFGLPGSLVGALKLNAYIITESGEDRGCSRIIYVNPASGLQIAAKLSQATYRPGETARMDFAVTDAAGQPAPAALGIAAVDESVFALSESRPGLLQQFLDVEADMMKPRYQIKSFESPAEFVNTANQNLALAYFASFGEQRSGLNLDEMVKNGYLPERLVEHLRSMQGTAEYESLRKYPEYSQIIQTIEGEGSLYNLRDETGPAKLHAVEAQRKAYFSRLKGALEFVFVCALLLLPIVLTIYNTRPGGGIFPDAVDSESNQKYIRLASASYRLLALLTLFPFLFYPMGAAFCDHRDVDISPWWLLGVEVFVVTVAVALQFTRITRATNGASRPCV